MPATVKRGCKCTELYLPSTQDFCIDYNLLCTLAAPYIGKIKWYLWPFTFETALFYKRMEFAIVTIDASLSVRLHQISILYDKRREQS